MKKVFGVVLAVFLVIPLAFGTAFGASAKATSDAGSIISIGNPEWEPIFTKDIHCSQDKSLFVTVSLETGLFTKGHVKTKGATATSELVKEWALAGLRVRVVVDGGPPDGSYALPDRGAEMLLRDPTADVVATAEGSGVSFNTRLLEVGAKLQGILNCPSGAAIPGDCDLSDEEIMVLLSTLSSHSFVFIVPRVDSGDHTISVEVLGVQDSSAGGDARAYAGAGTFTVEEVRMIKGDYMSF